MLFKKILLEICRKSSPLQAEQSAEVIQTKQLAPTSDTRKETEATPEGGLPPGMRITSKRHSYHYSVLQKICFSGISVAARRVTGCRIQGSAHFACSVSSFSSMSALWGSTQRACGAPCSSKWGRQAEKQQSKADCEQRRWALKKRSCPFSLDIENVKWLQLLEYLSSLKHDVVVNGRAGEPASSRDSKRSHGRWDVGPPIVKGLITNPSPHYQ